MKQHEKKEIYDILAKNFTAGVAEPLSKVGICLSDAGVNPAKYGFKKMKQLFQELDGYLVMYDVTVDRHVHPYIKLCPADQLPEEYDVSEEAFAEAAAAVEKYEENDVIKAENSDAVVAETTDYKEESVEEVIAGGEEHEGEKQDEAELPDWVSKPRWVIMPQEEDDKTEADVSDSDDPYPELPKTMEGGIYLAPKTMGKLNYYLKGVEEQPDEEVVKVLCQSFNSARAEGRLLHRGDSYRFRVDLKALNGDDMVASIKPSSYNGTNPNAHKWYLNFAGTQNAPGQYVKDSPGKTLEQFAFLGSWSGFLENLAERALNEPWDFSEGDEKKYDILHKYIQYTFYRLQLEDKICIDEEGGFAAFNTGLVNVHYDDIFACFELSVGEYETRWKFEDFCTAAGRGLGKRLVESFNPLPQPPKYFERKEDLFYDLEKELHCDFDHIIVDNISRFPIGFLREECHDFPEAMDILQEISDEMNYAEKRRELKALSDLIEDTPRLFNRLRHRVEDAISLAKKQVRWNFKTAVPCYFPTRNVMSLMLPLDLEEDGITDAALVVELTRSGNYQGQTILTLQQAYLDARLLCRPNNDWLTPQNIPMGEELEED